MKLYMKMYNLTWLCNIKYKVTIRKYKYIDKKVHTQDLYLAYYRRHQ